MSQVTSGIRSVFAIPRIYDAFEALAGVTAERVFWIREYLKPYPGARILDIGCGTAEILSHLPVDIEYTGFDLSHSYIEAARKKHGNRGRFHCAGVSALGSGAEMTGAEAGGFDIAMAFGVLHHLDDAEAVLVFEGARRALKPGGRFVTLDSAFVPGQSLLSRFVVSRDRGRNVRTPEAYVDLAGGFFPRVDATVMPKILRIPFDTVALICGE
jgi:SAM-dependent methyltransferase